MNWLQRSSVIILVLILGAGLFWFFIGGALTTTKVEEAAPQGEILKQGSFIAIDEIHKGSGKTKIVKVDNGYVLTLEDFQVTNGPDLYVYLSKNINITTEEQLGEFEELAVLKGNVGNQVYRLGEAQAQNANSIVIWCKRFGVLFSSATLQ